MANKKPKRKYKADPTATMKLLGLAKPYDDAEVMRLSILCRIPMHNITQGKGNVNDLNELITVSNVVRILSEKVGKDCLDVCEDAYCGLMDAKERFENTGRVGFCGEGIQAVHTMLDLYEEFLPHLTPVSHKDAWAEAGRRINETQRKTDKLGV